MTTSDESQTLDAAVKDRVTRMVQQAMDATKTPFFFGDVPAEPQACYPSPHVPNPALSHQLLAVFAHIDAMATMPEVDRSEAKQLVLLQFYLHGYRAGLKHAPLPKKAAAAARQTQQPDERFPIAYFHFQKQQLVKAGMPALVGMSEKEFSEYLTPLREAAEALPLSRAQVPLLLVIPYAWMPGKTVRAQRTALSQSIRYNGKPARTDGAGIEGFKDVVAGPKVPYLATDVNDGRNLVGVVSDEGNNPALRKLKRMKQLPLTLDEGLWLMHFFGQHLGLSELLLFGTRHVAARQMFTDLFLNEHGQIIIDNADVEWDETARHLQEHRVPYCAKRIPPPAA